MPRTTTRRARTAGLGGLAATTALALAAGPVAAATRPAAPELPVLALDAAPEDVAVSVYGSPADEDQQRLFDATPVAESGRVDLALSAPVVAGEAVEVGLVDLSGFEDADEVVDLQPLDVDVDVAVVDGEEGGTTLELTIPTDDDALLDVDEVQLTVTGLAVEDLPGTPAVASVTLDLQPSDLGQLLLEDPARVTGYADAAIQLDDVALQAGGSFVLLLPEESVTGALGVEDLTLLDAHLHPVDDDLGWFAAAPTGTTPGPQGAMGAAAATGHLDEMASAAAAAAAEEPATVAAGAVDEEDFHLDAQIAEDGRSAVLTSSADLPAGDYALLLSVAGDLELAVTGFATVEVSAAPVPAPTPAVTVAQPAPTAAATAVPARQNPGLRSNTGVEGGGADGGLLVTGAGLVVLAAGTGALAVRTGRRGRRA